MPAVAGLRSDTRVAGLAQRHEIVGVAAATFREWKDMAVANTAVDFAKDLYRCFVTGAIDADDWLLILPLT